MRCNSLSPHLASPKVGYSQVVSRGPLTKVPATGTKHEPVLKLAYNCILFPLELECTLRCKTVQKYLHRHPDIPWV